MVFALAGDSTITSVFPMVSFRSDELYRSAEVSTDKKVAYICRQFAAVKRKQ
jgi:hypothetical protein